MASFADPPSKERGSIGGLALSADERFLAVIFSRDDASTVSVWETGSWKAVRKFAPMPGLNYGISMVFSRDGRSLFVSNRDSTILEWDVSGRLRKKTETPNADRLSVLWRTLADTPEIAYPVVWEMLDHPAVSVPFLIGKLSPAKPIDVRRVRQLLGRLDAELFAEREEASRQILALGERTLHVLRRVLQDKPSLETRKRIEEIIQSLNRGPTSEQLRLLRALTVLEWSGSPSAGEHLKRLANGDPSVRVP
ncbi:MAG TPA: WD40 repeat domain-containing protein [Gemmataceae bacterium]|nr:WD40 repeat domain-containing protein [Gemmataceae bacterium]